MFSCYSSPQGRRNVYVYFSMRKQVNNGALGVLSFTSVLRLRKRSLASRMRAPEAFVLTVC